MLVIGQIGYAKSSLVKCLDEETEIVDPSTGVPRTIAEVFKDPQVDQVLTLGPAHVEAAPITAKVDVGLALPPRHLRVRPLGDDHARAPLPDARRLATRRHVAGGGDGGPAGQGPLPQEPVPLLDEEVDVLAILLAEGCYVPSQTGNVRSLRRARDHRPDAGRRPPPGVPGAARRALRLRPHRARGVRYATGRTLRLRLRRPDPPRPGPVTATSRASPAATPWAFEPPGAVATLLRRNGVPRALAKHKVIPDSVFRLLADQLARFLGVFWMCDGTVSRTGVEVTLASERMVRQLQHLLLRFGIQSRVRFHATAIGDRPFDAWNLRVYSHCERDLLDAIPLWGASGPSWSRCAQPGPGRSGDCGAPSASTELRAELAALTRGPDGLGRHGAVPRSRGDWTPPTGSSSATCSTCAPAASTGRRSGRSARCTGSATGTGGCSTRRLLGPHRPSMTGERLRPHRRADRLLRRK